MTIPSSLVSPSGRARSIQLRVCPDLAEATRPYEIQKLKSLTPSASAAGA